MVEVDFETAFVGFKDSFPRGDNNSSFVIGK